MTKIQKMELIFLYIQLWQDVITKGRKTKMRKLKFGRKITLK